MMYIKPTKFTFLLPLLPLLALCSCKAEDKIQTAIQQVSEEIMEQYEPLEGVMTLVADAKTGKILASVDMGGSGNNRPETYSYEPGSMFKIFSIGSIMFLPDGITADSKFTCDGFYKFESRKPIKCIKAHGEIDTGDIIKYSCFVGTCSAAETVTDKELYFMMRQFGFGASPGLLHEPSQWHDYSKYIIALGQ